MQMQFVTNPMSAYYKSDVFDRVLQYIGSNPRQCNLKESRGKRYMVVSGIDTVEKAVEILKKLMDNDYAYTYNNTDLFLCAHAYGQTDE